MPITAARKILVAFAVLIWALALSSAVHGATLTVELTNVHKAEGKILLQILQGESEFKGEQGAIASVMQRAVAGKMSFSTTLPSGTYALRIMHDMNGNGELDANFVGIPNEPWGFSNNATGNFGPPGWEDVKFDLQGDVTQVIELRK